MLAFLSYEIAWSRQARGYTLLQLLGFGAFGLHDRFLETRRRADAAAAALCLELAALTHPAWIVFGVAVGLRSLVELDRPAQAASWLRRQGGALLAYAVLAGATLWLMQAGSDAPTVRDWLQPRVAPAHGGYALLYGSFLGAHLGWTAAWAAVGAVLTLAGAVRRRALPLVGAGALYGYAISERSILFHFRYLLPVLPLAAALAGWGAAELMRIASRRDRPGRPARAALVLALFVASGWTGRFTLRPRAQWYLDPTAPQPDWRTAYAEAVRLHERRGGTPQTLVTAGTFPMFHDLYVGSGAGRKLFLPYSATGYPGEWVDHSAYSAAETVRSADGLAAVDGYVVLDGLGLRRLEDLGLRARLRARPPLVVVRGTLGYPVFIWQTGPWLGESRGASSAASLPLFDSP